MKRFCELSITKEYLEERSLVLVFFSLAQKNKLKKLQFPKEALMDVLLFLLF